MFCLLLANPALAREAQPGLFISPGEAWAFKVVNGQPAEARKLSPDDKLAKGEIVASFSEDGSMLRVRNSGDVSFNYQAFISRNPEDKGKRTSVCTLIPNVAMMESWPGGLPGLRLTNFSDAGEGMICA
ncbi:hypothetical protein [Novosphingobium sp. UBA6272]|uniref:hypothetical protein n=1 Tax=Novosphingobium sp. UBA6272 TaxID=1946984 RepID=UPI0025D3C380|nr:hypothetical protein [Novosphingobium sp. UBA6272]